MKVCAKACEGKRQGFTLIELLAVVALISIIIIIALPIFESATRRSLSTPVPELASTLRLARQHAVTKRQTVWVVFPDREQTSYTGGDVDKALRSYAVIANTAMGNATSFTYLTEWKYLPRGIYFNDDSPAGVNPIMESYHNTRTRFPFPNDAASGSQIMPAIQFRPNGRAYTISSSTGEWGSGSVVHIRLVEGIVEVNTNTGLAQPLVATGSSNLTVELHKLTCRIKFEGV
jgi:prepilin-type N-terminal cleavage/methylation domain-containing protein